jgi:hypothetical protein
MTDDTPIAIPHNEHGQPDLQALVRRAGERYAASVGEKYDPQNNPKHGGYQHITAEEWVAWDAANRQFQQRRRGRLAPPPGRK